MISVALRQDEGEEQVEDDLAIVDRIARHVRHKPMPELGESAVSARVDVQVAEHDCVQAVRLCWPLQHWLEPGHVGGEAHAGERANGLVGQIQGVAWRVVDDVRDDLKEGKVDKEVSSLRKSSPRCP